MTAATVVGIDFLEVTPLDGVTILHMDFTDEDADARLKEALGGEADLGVDDAVVGQVLDELPGHPAQVAGRLHHRDGVVEGLQVAHQGPGVRGLGEPAGQRLRVPGG